MPNRIGRSRKSDTGLHDLTQSEHNDQSEKRPHLAPEDPHPKKINSQQVNDPGADDEQCVCRPRMLMQIKVRGSCYRMDPVGNCRGRRTACADERLRPKPDRQRDRRHSHSNRQRRPEPRTSQGRWLVLYHRHQCGELYPATDSMRRGMQPSASPSFFILDHDSKFECSDLDLPPSVGQPHREAGRRVYTFLLF